jgi:hypothetical protein
MKGNEKFHHQFATLLKNVHIDIGKKNDFYLSPGEGMVSHSEESHSVLMMDGRFAESSEEISYQHSESACTRNEFQILESQQQCIYNDFIVSEEELAYLERIERNFLLQFQPLADRIEHPLLSVLRNVLPHHQNCGIDETLIIEGLKQREIEKVPEMKKT